MNTAVEYMYRDADNYKQFRVAVFAGRITAEQEQTIRGALDDGTHLLAAQVGLTELWECWPKPDPQSDHIWHELVSIEATDAPVTEPVAVDEFAALFVDLTWDEETADARLQALFAAADG